ncbi:MAG: hypothetical protein H8D34_29875, partial [Chloroflexi bacterium]|nr:hypothetical protein [Chloroflexota bacterium]
GAGSSVGIGFAGSGVWSENKIGVNVNAFIDDDTAIGGGITDGIYVSELTLKAQDTSSIIALAGAASLAASFSSSAALSVSIGVSLAQNFITSETNAYINNANDGVRTTTGDIVLDARSTAIMKVVSAAAAVAAGFSGGGSGAVSGAGADAANIILTKTNAYIVDSIINSAGNVDLNATNTSTIIAVIVSAAFSLSISGGAGVGASLGLALARNFIGFDVGFDIASDYTTASTDKTISVGETVKIETGIRAGDIYRYKGDEALTRYEFITDDGEKSLTAGKRVVVDPDYTYGGVEGIYSYVGDDDTLNLSTQDYRDENLWAMVDARNFTGQDFGNRDQWELANIISSPSTRLQVQAYTENSSITAVGNLTADANSNQSITAVVFAGSAAVTGSGGAGIALSGAGANAVNRIATTVTAAI